jgi:hypothetical protein
MADKAQTEANVSPPAAGTKETTATGSHAESTPPTTIDIDKTKPEDFEGDLATNNSLPTDETLAKIQDYVVLDRDGKTHTFKSLYNGPNVARRVLVIFVRHFFCSVRLFYTPRSFFLSNFFSFY